MDFALTDEQIALKKEWEDFYREIMKDAPKNWRGNLGIDRDALYGEGYEKSVYSWWKRINDAENERGYLNISWPKEYGGQGIGVVEELLLREIQGYYRVPRLNWAGNLVVSALLRHGTKEQKHEFLPRILNGEYIFCQAWSEPNAGSDLASLTSRAVRDGSDYIVNGEKIWVSSALTIANWGHGIFRTDPDIAKRHRGLSYFMFPLDAPGITVNGVRASNDRLLWGELLFDDVKIPAKYMIGKENEGWYVTMTTADSERSVAQFGARRRDIEEVVVYCMETKRNGRRLIDDPSVREGLAELCIECERLRSASYRLAWEKSKGRDASKHASANKIIRTELIPKLADFIAHKVGGLYGQMRLGSRWALFDGVYENLWEIGLGIPINVGTNDIQRNVIATWGLGLPKK